MTLCSTYAAIIQVLRAVYVVAFWKQLIFIGVQYVITNTNVHSGNCEQVPSLCSGTLQKPSGQRLALLIIFKETIIQLVFLDYATIISCFTFFQVHSFWTWNFIIDPVTAC